MEQTEIIHCPDSEIRNWRSKTQIAEHYHCNVRTVTNLMQRRILPYVKIGRFVRFDLVACDRAMLKYERPSALL